MLQELLQQQQHRPQHADLAEKYVADDELEPGTVVCFGGEAEVTACDIEDHAVAGVVSQIPYLMNLQTMVLK